jgi:hypothetical protein
MDILESGYLYRLKSFKGSFPQEIRFTQKLITGGFVDGTTNEEVVDMLIARFYALQAKNPSPENQCVIIMLKSVKELLSRRLTKKIKKNEEREKSPEDKREFDSEDIFADLERSIRFDASGTRSTKSAYRD